MATNRTIKNIIGRENELERLQDLFDTERAEFIAMYGRRRIGKTYLIREFFSQQAELFISVSGRRKGTTKEQLSLFQTAIEKAFFGGERIPQFRNWMSAFEQLSTSLRVYATNQQKQKKIKKVVLVLDELPWLATPRSKLLDALDHYWNTALKDIPGFKLIICGSAASWMLDKIVLDKGGLHNRLTASMRLLPFTFDEVKEFLSYKGLKLSIQQAIQLHLVFGGVPYYLDLAPRRKTATEIVEQLCFGNGELVSELEKLFASLFQSSKEYLKIVTVLGKKREGVSRGELMANLQLPSGGELSGRLDELREAGFIEELVPYGRQSRDVYYRLIDEFVLFALRWMKKSPKGVMSQKTFWSEQTQTPAYASWAGYAFENLCIKHHELIRHKLGITGIRAEVGSWRYVAKNKNEKGAQIDLLFDRSDGAITLCEVKYTKGRYTFTKQDSEELQRKEAIFVSKTKTNKQIQWCMICNGEFKENEYSKEILTKFISLEKVLF
jgi:AAA+ ATPase superfamily predicted ATPase